MLAGAGRAGLVGELLPQTVTVDGARGGPRDAGFLRDGGPSRGIERAGHRLRAAGHVFCASQVNFASAALPWAASTFCKVYEMRYTFV